MGDLNGPPDLESCGPVVVVFGTRPEAIKLAPVVRSLRSTGVFDVRVVSTGQHRELVQQACGVLEMQVDHDLALMEERQSLPDLVSRAVSGVAAVVRDLRPSCVVVQGDTATAFAAALAAFYEKAPVAHVEAGLRSGCQGDPFPEEANRRMVAALSKWHFAPTERARRNLLDEGIDPAHTLVTGNTGIDTLRWLLESGRGASAFQTDRKKILVTMHRRENQDTVIPSASHHLRQLADSGYEVVLPLHPSPAVREVIIPRLQTSGVQVIEPLGYPDFVRTLAAADLVITDSGGVQEEAPYLGVPVLVTRRTTERAEAVDAGLATVVGEDLANLGALAVDAIEKPPMSAEVGDLFGDGYAAGRITACLTASLRPRAVSSEEQAA